MKNRDKEENDTTRRNEDTNEDEIEAIEGDESCKF